MKEWEKELKRERKNKGGKKEIIGAMKEFYFRRQSKKIDIKIKQNCNCLNFLLRNSVQLGMDIWITMRGFGL